MHRYVLTLVVALLPTLACAAADQADSSQVGAGVVARYGDQTISRAQLDSQDDFRLQLTAVKQQEYDVTRDYLEKMIFDRLVDQAAANAGVTREEYLASEVDAKAGQPTDQEIDRVMAAYRSRLNPDPDKARQQVVSLLTQQRQQQRRADLQKELFAAAHVEILLDPVRFEPVLAGHPSRGGGEDAPVTLVEYSDFQCPYCGRVQPTLDEIVRRYDGKLRHVFKQLPLPMHPNAQRAAEASLCAADQGRFWELHDWMFTNQGKLDRDSIVAEAKTLGMDESEFSSCLDSGKHSEDIARDTKEAQSFGINGTPGFLIQGRALHGAQPMEAFTEVINEELQRAGVEVPPEPTPEPTPQPVPQTQAAPQAPVATPAVK